MRTRLTVLLTVVVVAGVLATPVASAEEPPEDGVITESTTLTMDYEGGIVIGADGITLNCAGHRIYGEDNHGVTLLVRAEVTVKNCVIDGFGVGVLLEDSHGNTIKNNTSLYPVHHGFTLTYSEDNRVVGNTAYSSESHGFVLVDSDRNELKHNVGSSDGGLAGFHILGSSLNDFKGNRVEGYGAGFTIEDGPWVDVFWGSDHNVFTDNRVEHSEWVGFWVTGGSTDNQFTRNRSDNSQSGFSFSEAPDNRLVGNTATNNTDSGFRLCDYSTGNHLDGNLAAYNQGEGPEGEAVGFRVCDYSDDTVLTGNVAEHNGIGFAVHDADRITLTGNKARFHDEGGFALSNTDGSLLVNNVTEFNDEGVWIAHNVTGTIVKGNMIRGSAGEGVMIALGSTGNWIVENKIRDNFVGFYAWGSSPDNIVEGNKFCHNDDNWWGTNWANEEDSPTEYIDNKVCGPDN